MKTAELLSAMARTETLLRTLEAVDAKIPYQAYAKQVGIMREDEEWVFRKHTGLISRVLYATGAVANECDETIPAHRIVDAQTGKPGKGNYHRARIVIDRAEGDP